MKNNFPTLAFLIFLMILSSCRTRKEMVYLQGTAAENAAGQSANFEAIIQPDDILHVVVMSQSVEATEPFTPPGEQASGSAENLIFRGYLVDKEGLIELPMLGKLKVSGMTRTELIESLREKLKVYITDVQVSVRILNFKVSVLGEVKSPGQVTVRGDRITILEAISQAGDLTVQGTRENVLIVRDNDGQKSFARINLTDANLVNSDFYYLKQNDVVYVEPKRAAYNVSSIGPYLTTTASILSLLVTVTLLITRI